MRTPGELTEWNEEPDQPELTQTSPPKAESHAGRTNPTRPTP